MAEPMNTCSFCRKIVGDDRDEDVGVQSPHGATICLGCAAESVLAAYAGGFRSEALERGIRELFEISAQTEAEVIAIKSKEIADRYQRRLLDAREPEPTPDEGDRVHVGVTITKFTKRKIEALASEASMNVSTWIRHAIWLAFQITKAGPDITLRRDDTRDA